MTKPTLNSLRDELRTLADPLDAVHLQRFFRTGPGEYAEGDRFLGLRVPVLRRLARVYRDLPAEDVLALLRSEWHEERLLALLLWVQEYARASQPRRDEIFREYLASTRFINNWDLVDSSAEHIVGAQLRERDRGVLDRLARSESVWERRIAVLATFHFIKRDDFEDTLRIAGMLLEDRHDVIHKATGWMLREIGQRDRAAEEAFLQRHAARMPRTMLRYAIERFEEPRRKAYLAVRRVP
jgi:3-methyladenine DNA glycosylase AlkD